jgi:hypothetical protein
MWVEGHLAAAELSRPERRAMRSIALPIYSCAIANELPGTRANTATRTPTFLNSRSRFLIATERAAAREHAHAFSGLQIKGGLTTIRPFQTARKSNLPSYIVQNLVLTPGEEFNEFIFSSQIVEILLRRHIHNYLLAFLKKPKHVLD